MLVRNILAVERILFKNNHTIKSTAVIFVVCKKTPALPVFRMLFC